jgi:hypothetical protein
MTAESPSWLELQQNLGQILDNWEAARDRLRERNRHSPQLLEVSDQAVQRLRHRMMDVRCHYVQRRLVELCPAKGTMTRRAAWIHLLHHARNVFHDALGTGMREQAHAERLSRREEIVLNEALGDLERAAPEQLRHLDRVPFEGGDGFDGSNRRLKARLFRAAVAQIKALLDRRDGGQWWFPETLAVSNIIPAALSAERSSDDGIESEAPASPGTLSIAVLRLPPDSPPVSSIGAARSKKPGRPRKEESAWFRFLEDHRAALSAGLTPAISQDELGRFLGISRRRLYDLDRNDPGGDMRRIEMRLAQPITDLINKIKQLRDIRVR